MEERILEIVFYLVQHARVHKGRIGPFRSISRDLKNLGFTESEISSAYSWFLDELQKEGGKIDTSPRMTESVRVLSAEEMENFSPDAIGFLMQLVQMQLLRQSQFENIVERSFLVGPEQIDLTTAKVIASRYVFSTGKAVDLTWFNVEDDETIN